MEFEFTMRSEIRQTQTRTDKICFLLFVEVNIECKNWVDGKSFSSVASLIHTM